MYVDFSKVINVIEKYDNITASASGSGRIWASRGETSVEWDPHDYRSITLYKWGDRAMPKLPKYWMVWFNYGGDLGGVKHKISSLNSEEFWYIFQNALDILNE